MRERRIKTVLYKRKGVRFDIDWCSWRIGVSWSRWGFEKLPEIQDWAYYCIGLDAGPLKWYFFWSPQGE